MAQYRATYGEDTTQTLHRTLVRLNGLSAGEQKVKLSLLESSSELSGCQSEEIMSDTRCW